MRSAEWGRGSLSQGVPGSTLLALFCLGRHFTTALRVLSFQEKVKGKDRIIFGANYQTRRTRTKGPSMVSRRMT